MQKEEIILVGGGGHCRSAIDVIEEENKFRIVGIIDVEEKVGEKILGYPIIADDTKIEELTKKYHYFHITLGFIKNPDRRIELFNIIEKSGGKFPVIVSPFAVVSRHAVVEKGTIIMHNAQVNACSHIEHNCIINSKALIEHDAVIGHNSHISTGAIINGNAVVGSSCFIGSGSVVVNGAQIPEKTFIKANQLFIK
jgi:sugar O-acyltransferase (sialic acid O-acetyltransferase NeuD family)